LGQNTRTRLLKRSYAPTIAVSFGIVSDALFFEEFRLTI
jgi:hypothetical protein